jgi:hypothetical protein
VDLGINVYDWAAVVVPPIVALATLSARRRAVVAFIVVAVAAYCWGLLLLSSAHADAQAAVAFNVIRNPSAAQIRAFSADGASKSMLYLFGLPFSLCYAAGCFLIIRIARRWFHA